MKYIYIINTNTFFSEGKELKLNKCSDRSFFLEIMTDQSQ